MFSKNIFQKCKQLVLYISTKHMNYSKATTSNAKLIHKSQQTLYNKHIIKTF
jgi:hypothetical protein